ncbi:hypothetical protein EYS34_17410 [Cronobacter sakazakii]|nr:hypothetical protein EYS34_17410 [Cronobacter sakazakii]
MSVYSLIIKFHWLPFLMVLRAGRFRPENEQSAHASRNSGQAKACNIIAITTTGGILWNFPLRLLKR